MHPFIILLGLGGFGAKIGAELLRRLQALSLDVEGWQVDHDLADMRSLGKTLHPVDITLPPCHTLSNLLYDFPEYRDRFSRLPPGIFHFSMPPHANRFLGGFSLRYAEKRGRLEPMKEQLREIATQLAEEGRPIRIETIAGLAGATGSTLLPLAAELKEMMSEIHPNVTLHGSFLLPDVINFQHLYLSTIEINFMRCNAWTALGDFAELPPHAYDAYHLFSKPYDSISDMVQGLATTLQTYLTSGMMPVATHTVQDHPDLQAPDGLYYKIYREIVKSPYFPLFYFPPKYPEDEQ